MADIAKFCVLSHPVSILMSKTVKLQLSRNPKLNVKLALSQ